MEPLLYFRISTGLCLLVVFDNDALLLDAGLLTSELTQVVQLGTTYFTVLVHLNAVNVRRFDREDTLYAYST